MTQDFASNNRKGSGGKRKSPGNQRTQAKTGKPSPASPGLWFGAGLLCGIFFCGLLWLKSQQPDPAATAVAAGTSPQPTADKAADGPRFDFYTLLPGQKVEVEIDAASLAASRNPESRADYLLQAGSFKQAQDADRRRGELLLLGLDAHVEKTSVDNGSWHRVYIGPFESRSKLAKARSLTAQQGIDTLLLKRPHRQG
jgi:cell division protein FtsN